MLTKYLVYEAYVPPYHGPEWRAVEASGQHGLMEGIAPESRVYSWWAEDAEMAIDTAKRFLGEHKGEGG